MAADRVGAGGRGFPDLNGSGIGGLAYRVPHQWAADLWASGAGQQQQQQARARGGQRIGAVEEMAGDKVVAGGNGVVDEINGIKSGNNRWSAANRWKPNGVPPKGTLIGLSNGGGSFSDTGSEEDYEDDEEHEGEYAGGEEAGISVSEEHSQELDGGYGDDTELPSKEISEDDGEYDGEKVVEASDEDEDLANDLEADNEEDDNLIDHPPTMNRGANNHSLGFNEDEMEEDGYEYVHPVAPDVPPSKSRGREKPREIVAEAVRGASEGDIDKPKALFPMSRGMEDRGQSSAPGIHLAVVREKAAKGMIDSSKKKAEPPRNGAEPKPKKGKAPAAPKKKSGGGEAKDRTRLSTDVKARVTLERAREILAAVKAAMLKDSPPTYNRRVESRAVDNFSSSEDERVPYQAPPPRLLQQTKFEEKVVKKRSRPSKAEGKEAAAKRKAPKVSAEHLTTEEKVFHQRPRVAGPGHESIYKSAHFSATSGDSMGDAKGSNHREVVFEQQVVPVAEKKVRKRKKKDAHDGPLATGLCPGSLIRDENWIPPASPFGLIQESLYKDPWKVLLSCMLLNKTAGRQMHKVIWDLFNLCPDAQTAIDMDTAKIAEKVYSLGLQNKRAKMIQRFSYEYLHGEWTNVSQLHGIGKYAADAYAIFCQGLWRDVQPDDAQLNKYWTWLRETDGMGAAFTPETS